MKIHNDNFKDILSLNLIKTQDKEKYNKNECRNG